jgi:hypothetical protein
MRGTLFYHTPFVLGLCAVVWLNVAVFRRARHPYLRITQLGVIGAESLMATIILFNEPRGFWGIVELVGCVFLIAVIVPLVLGGLLRLSDRVLGARWTQTLAEHAPTPIDPFAPLSDEAAARLPGMRPCRLPSARRTPARGTAPANEPT